MTFSDPNMQRYLLELYIVQSNWLWCGEVKAEGSNFGTLFFFFFTFCAIIAHTVNLIPPLEMSYFQF